MTFLNGKHVLLGVTGGIAAYKSADLVRRLRAAGAEVRVVMTAAATAFVAPLTFQALSGNPVHQGLLDPDTEAAMGHIELARWADIVLVAPATADFMARLAHGHADDLLATVCLATSAPMLLAPAMNQQMWQARATRANFDLLRDRGVRMLGPGSGDQACGETGPGRMLEPMALVEDLVRAFGDRSLAGRRVVVTAGPTREAIDPVRFVSNRSSGKMGYAIAGAAVRAGAEVVLVSGPTALPDPPGVKVERVESAGEMLDAVLREVAGAAVFVATAAVADYRPVNVATGKIKKHAATLSIALERTPDILGRVAGLADRPYCVGFAAETEQVLEYARQKLEKKRLDMIVANRVGPGLGFDTDDNAVTVLWPDGELAFERAPKDTLARRLIQLIAERLHDTG